MKTLQALLALYTIIFLPLHAASLDDLTYTTTDGEVTITDCDTAATGELVIPNNIEGNPVTSIGYLAFLECVGLTSITIPDSVTSIDVAFIGCTSLTNIEVSSGNMNYTNVEGVLFNRGKTLLHTYPTGKAGDYVIPDGVTSIGEGAFAYCTRLTSITIPDGVPSIGEGAFYSCTSLKRITIPNSVTSIGNYAFEDCTSLTGITIPDGVTSIEASTFLNCTSLTSITIPDGVTSIGERAFFGCTSLTRVTFTGAAPTLGADVFFGVANGAVALVFDSTFGPNLGIWNGLKVVTLVAGADFSGGDLSGADLSDVDLSGFDLSNLEAEEINFTRVDLTGANLRGANLEGANFTGANLSNADLTDADLDGAFYTDAILSNVTTNNQVLLNMIEIQKIQSQLALLADALAAKDVEIATKNERIAQLEDLSDVPLFNLLLEEKDEQIASLELRPTQAAYDTVVTERDARPTLEEIQDARTGSVILTPSEDGTVQLKIEIEESSDLEVWENQGKSVEAGFPLAEGKKFLRFALK